MLIALALLPAGVAALIWLLRRPARAVAVYAAAMPVGSAFALPVGLPRSFTTASSLIGGVAAVAMLRQMLLRRAAVTRPHPAVAVWLFLLAHAAVTATWSIAPGVTLDALLVLTSLVALFVVAALYPFTKADVATISGGIVIGSALTGVYGIFLAASSSLQTTGAGVARFAVTGGGAGEDADPNITAAALLLGFAIAVGDSFSMDDRRMQRWSVVATALIGGGIVLTASRGGLLAAALVVVITALRHRRGITTVAVIGLVMLPSLLLIPETLAERVDNTGTTGRAEIWELAISSCPEYCARGSGYGTFGEVHEAAFLDEPGASGLRMRFQAHSIWFEALIELGVTGLVVTAVALIWLAQDLWRLPVAIGGGAFTGVVALLVTNSFLSTSTFKYFWLVIMFGTIVYGVHRRAPTAPAVTAAARGAPSQ